MTRLALFLACLAFSAVAQETQEAKPAPQPSERPALNLKLDNPGAWATVAPSTAPKDANSSLPSLGEDARAMPTEVPRADTRTVYPKDTQPGGR